MTARIFSFGTELITAVKDGDNVWFYGREVAETLGYKRPSKAIQVHVKDDEKRKVQKIGSYFRTSSFSQQNREVWQINETGLYRLVFSSKLRLAEDFRKWVFSEVLPSIRRTGQYTRCNQLSIMNENDLHYSVVKYIRTYHPNTVIVPGLGENQDTSTKRSDSWRKGYAGGQPDLIVPQMHKWYNGFAIEMKTPNGGGKVKRTQLNALRALRSQGYETLLSSSLHEIIHFIEVYMRGSRVVCEYCSRRFVNSTTLSNHQRYFHRVGYA